MKNLNKLLAFFLIGILTYNLYKELFKERDHSELKRFADKINLDLNEYLDSEHNQNKKRNYITLIKDTLNLPKQVRENKRLRKIIS